MISVFDSSESLEYSLYLLDDSSMSSSTWMSFSRRERSVWELSAMKISTCERSVWELSYPSYWGLVPQGSVPSLG